MSSPLRTRPGRSAAGLLAILLSTAPLAACSGHTAQGSPTASAGTATAASTAPAGSPAGSTGATPTDTGAPSTSAAAPTSPAATGSTGTPSGSPSSSSTGAATAACANGTIRTSAQRAAALPGQEIAILRFTNTGAQNCSLTGFPGVELITSGHPVGKPATRTGDAVQTLVLAPGGSVTARLTDQTQCNAPLADTVGVYAPNQSVQVRLPISPPLRACSLHIAPVRR